MVVTFHEDTVFNDDPDWKKPDAPGFIENLKQQKLKGRYFVVTRRYAISITVFFGLFFIGISFLIKSANRQVILKRIRYDNTSTNYIDFKLDHHIPNPIYFYYELRNTFLMHRSINAAFCHSQLFGRFGNPASESSCDTWKLSKYSCENPTIRSVFSIEPHCDNNQKYYAPVGGRASVMFNDSFLLKKGDQEFHWTEKGVVSEKLQSQFLEPVDPSEREDLCSSKMFKNTVKPIGWQHHICKMGGYQNITFIKWLESTTNKNFKKFYRILKAKDHPFGLRKGNYRLYVDNVYWPKMSKTPHYRMEKYFWILHPSWIGSEQKFLELMYLLVGIGLLTLSSFLVGLQIFLIKRRKSFDEEDKDFDF